MKEAKLIFSYRWVDNDLHQIYELDNEYAIVYNNKVKRFENDKILFTLDELADLVIELEEKYNFGNIGDHYLGCVIMQSGLLNDYTFIDIGHELSQMDKMYGMVKYRWEKKL